MKTRLLLLFSVFLATGAVKAQTEFAPIGATWYYGIMEAMWGDTGFTKTTVTDSAVIDGKKVKVLVSEYHQSDGGVFPRDTVYAYQTGDSVFFYLDGAFHLVYNFSLNVGDTMELYNPDNKYCGDDLLYGHVVVESIKTLNINGTQLKEFNFISADPQYEHHSKFSDYYQYIEKIGTTSHLFGADCIADNFGAGIFGDLRCYEDEEFGHYQYSRAACDSLYVYDWTNYYHWLDSMQRVDVIDRENLDLRVFYSQSDKAIVVDSHGSCNQSVINVFDINGIMVYSVVCEPDTQIHFAPKRNGVYIVLISNNVGTYYEKIIAY